MGDIIFHASTLNNGAGDDIDYKLYEKATHKVGDKLTEILNGDDSSIFVKYISGRVKSRDSLMRKMKKMGLEYNRENLEGNIHDVAGLRVVCLYKDDIYKIINKIKDSGIKLIKHKDYVTMPKKSGYSGYHLIVSTDIDGKEVNVEIQIRTLGMDLWSSLDHLMRYKKFTEIGDVSADDLYDYLYLKYRSSDLFELLTKTINSYDEKLTNLNKLSKSNDIFVNQNNLFNLDMSDFDKALDVLNDVLTKEIDFTQNGKRLVEHRIGRIKNEKNVFSKLNRKNNGNFRTIDLYSEISRMSDIVGYRLVVPFLSDIDLVYQKLVEYSISHYDVLRIDIIQDYVKNPKENGYSSYHINAYVNINANDTSKEPKWVRTEIQIRTLAMDLWASYQRKLCYHKENSMYNDVMSDFAKVCRNIDNEFDVYGRLIREEKKDNSKTKKLELINM